jgi:hypothetical protein
MYHHENRQEETNNNMHQVSEMQTTGAEYSFDKKHIGEHQCPSSNDYQRHEDIKNKKVCYLLKGVELTPAVYRKWRFLAAEDSKQVKLRLLWYIFLEIPPSQPVKESILGKQVP